MKNLFFALIIGAVCTSASAKSKNKIYQVDDSQMLQALLDKGGVINLPAGRSFITTKTLYLKNNSEVINGNMCTITYLGNDAAIDFQKLNNKTFPVRNVINNLSIVLQTKGAVGIRWQGSYSKLSECAIALKSSDQTGFQLCGDVNGTGSYYNLFENCFVQGTSQLGNANDYGWKFTYDKSAPSRSPNSNTWVGGRIGQCAVAMYINGVGNVVNHMTAEGCDVAFYFENMDSKVGCTSNKVVMPYIEVCKTAFKFGTHSLSNIATSPYITGASSVKEDVGANNILNLTN